MTGVVIAEAVAPAVVLASQSPARRRLLAAAGVVFQADSPRVDEEEVKRSLRAAGAKPEQAAEQLAELKALKVSQRHPGALVIGADQLLVCDGAWFDKPADRAAALAQLEALQGRTHRLVTALVVARDGQRLWHHQEAPRITLRQLERAQLERYLEAAGEAVLSSVGAYHLEGLGAQLMLKVEGDHFTVQGLPLLPLLEFLRRNKALP